MTHRFFIALFSLVVLNACDDPRVGEFRTSLRSEKYVRSAATAHHVVEVRHLPHALRVMDEARASDTLALTTAVFDSLERSAGHPRGILFLMRIGPRDSSRGPRFDNDLIYGSISGHGDYRDALHEFSFGLKEKIWLEVSGSKVPLASYQMENSFGMTRARYFVLSFRDLPELEEGRKISVDLVLDDIVPGLTRKKLQWTLPVGKYDNGI